MNHNTLKKTELVVREDNSIYGEYDYIDMLQLKIEIIKGNIPDTLYYRNQYGGIDLIDKFGCSTYRDFENASDLLVSVVKAQMTKRMAESEKLETK
jgi:hypothetical protein